MRVSEQVVTKIAACVRRWMDRDRVSRGAAMLLLPSLLLLLPPPSLPMLLPLPHLHAEPRRRRPGPPLPTLPHRHAERRRLRSGPPGRRCLCCHVATRKGAAATRARPCLRRNIVTWNGGGGARPAPAYAATLSGGTAPPPPPGPAPAYAATSPRRTAAERIPARAERTLLAIRRNRRAALASRVRIFSLSCKADAPPVAARPALATRPHGPARGPGTRASGVFTPGFPGG